ncbi:MAG: bifunctional folylpolyglutamate synthase/dihydrofolate synthase, partial [Panacagrimonas sp.]
AATMAAEILRAAGYRAGLYTSPHLLRYHERIRIDGQPIEDAGLCAAFAAVEAARKDVTLTYFEFGTLAALWWFQQQAVDVQVLEVGLGGRLDAVNLMDADAALLTSIDIDHSQWLGDDRHAIGWEKAHIFRAGRAAICADPTPPPSVAAHARKIGADLQRFGVDFRISVTHAAWRWRGRDQALSDLPFPNFSGAFQLRNAAGVIAALKALAPKVHVDSASIARGLTGARLAGRFERRGKLILDVAHNLQAAQALLENLHQLQGQGDVALVLGMLRDKPVEDFCRALKPAVRHCHFVGLDDPRALNAQALARRARAAGLDGSCHANMAQALTQAQARCADQQCVLVTGSFLTVAAALESGSIRHG